jgi:hypothetical protein
MIIIGLCAILKFVIQMSLPGITFFWCSSIKLLRKFKVILISPFPSIKYAHKKLVDFCDMSSIGVHVPTILP